MKTPNAKPAADQKTTASKMPVPDAVEQPDILMCILSYFGILALIPFFVKKDDPFISWHARQGVLLMIASFVGYLALFVLMMIPFVGILAFLLTMAFGVGVIAISIMCIVQACQGNKWPIPVLSGFLGIVGSSKS